VVTSHDALVADAFARFLYVHCPTPRSPRPFDRLLITGDLATSGHTRDLQRAQDLLDAPAAGLGFRTASGEPTLSFLPPICEILPGNHDRYRGGLRFGRPGGTRFDAVFVARWTAGQGAALTPTIVRRSAALVTVCADFSLPRGDRGQRAHKFLPGWLGQGRVTNSTLDALVDLTQQEIAARGDEGLRTAVIWAIHFDPHTTDEVLQLLDSDRLLEAAQRNQVIAILCGHTHESKVKTLGTGVRIFACGSTTQACSPQGNDFQVLEFDVPEDFAQPVTSVLFAYRYSGHRRFGRLPPTIAVS
jgi:3',5'-cyclic AMP phosphodiesterase CpdA